MKQYFLAIMRDSFSPLKQGYVCMGTHADIHFFLNKLNPLLIEHFDKALEGLREKESDFLKIDNYECCLTRLV